MNGSIYQVTSLTYRAHKIAKVVSCDSNVIGFLRGGSFKGRLGTLGKIMGITTPPPGQNPMIVWGFLGWKFTYCFGMAPSL